jgi:hypothetical protein
MTKRKDYVFKGVCVGGPLDGTILEHDRYLYEMFAPVTPSPEVYFGGTPKPMNIVTEQVNYLYTSIGSKGMWALSSFEQQFEAVDLLLDFYAKHRKDFK